MVQRRVTDPHGPEWLLQAADIARSFYVEGRSKVEIAERLGVSRFKVARILEEARELGLVKVSIELPSAIDAGASAALKEHLGLRVVVLSPQVSDAVRNHLGRLGAALLSERVTAEDVLGLTCSRSVASVASALTSLAPCDVIQLTGTLAGPDGEPGSVESVRRAAAVGGGRQFPLYAPMVLTDAETTRALSHQDAIRRVLDLAPTVTIAVVSIGGWSPGASTVWDVASDAEREHAVNAGGVGEIGGRLFDARGQAVVTDLDERVLGVVLEDLRTIPEVVALAHGADRAEAVRAAVTGRLLSALVCDHALARALLELAPVEAAS